MSAYKGLDVLLEAMPLLWRRHPDLTLMVAGAGERPKHPLLSDERVTVRSEHIPDKEVPKLFAGTTCLVLPYRQASQSGVGSLAKRYGRPIVATAVGGLPELVGDGSGMVVPPEDSEQLADAVLRILDDRALAERMGEAGTRAVEREAGWRAIAERTLDAYERCLLTPDWGGRRPRRAPPDEGVGRYKRR
jgi:glycosyltransferase involved in cell wall biosynthesis